VRPAGGPGASGSYGTGRSVCHVDEALNTLLGRLGYTGTGGGARHRKGVAASTRGVGWTCGSTNRTGRRLNTEVVLKESHNAGTEPGSPSGLLGKGSGA